MTQPTPATITTEPIRFVMLGTIEEAAYLDTIVDEMLLDTGTGDRSKAFRQVLRQHARLSGRPWPSLIPAKANGD